MRTRARHWKPPEGLRPEDFYRERHGTIYAAMLELYHESEPVDTLTVIDRLKARGKLDELKPTG